MKYYKVRLTDNGAEVEKISNKKGKDGKDTLYVTEEELEMLNQNTIIVTIPPNLLTN